MSILSGFLSTVLGLGTCFSLGTQNGNPLQEEEEEEEEEE
jgi:hypothetical protein